MTYRIPLYRSESTEADVRAVSAILRRQTYWAEGQEIQEFERALIDYTGVPGVVLCNSGTSALHMALIAAGIKRGAHVIVPSFTFQATANASLFVGAKPVFADIEPETYGLDVADVESRITKRTKAIIAVHYAGCACQIGELRRLAGKHHLTLIEDACEALGSRIAGRHVGTWGDVSVLSFCANKVLSTGEGGAVLTDTKRIHDRMLEIRCHGRADNQFVSLGYNFRMPTVLAALGLSQLSHIQEAIRKRQQVARWYDMALANIPGVETFRIPPDRNHVYQLYTIRTPHRDKVMQALEDNRIQSKVYFPPIHQSPYYRSLGYKDRLPVTERLSAEVLSLPMYPSLSLTDISFIAQTIREVKY